MRITIQNPVNERRESLWFPWKAEDFEKACLSLEILPSTEPNCTIVAVSDESLSTLLKDKPCNIDELDYLMKRFDSFDRDELQTFYAMAYAEKAETTADLINITFNTHCYSLVADFSNLDGVGKKMYLTEQGAVSEKELQEFDGRAYFEKLLAENPNTRITPYGILYQNKNPIQTIYDGLHFPLYHWQDEMAELEVGKDGYSQFLYLPCTQMQIEYALLRLDADSLSDCNLGLTSDHFPETMLEIITSDKPLYENVDNLNYFASKFREIGTQEESYFEKLMEFVQSDNQKDLKTLLDSMYEFELFPNIHTAEEYGKYIICESGHFDYDENLEEYIDFERYGKQKIASENGAFTEKGYVLYHGYNGELAQVLWEHFGIAIPKQDFQELKLYMPLCGTTYYDENDYGDLYQVDYKIDVCPDELAEYKDEILQAIERNALPEETERGLMRYYCDQDSVNAKVKRYDFTAEEVNGQLMGVANLILNAPLDDRELARIKDEITGQTSDGWGEGFEQREIKCNGKEVNVSFWGAKNWSLQTSEELEIKLQNHDMKFGGM
ncbi:antirestriction protein (ArdA) [Anaerotignum neopropionicum]|uniref:Antirestriction protein (ArdA) n=1 Tax=Anaerotignum neopropionicum TaxID=36847 RepID=A0A136WH38_9FIRM|nr:antirestriction protein ArdA [Anaerotignum neopropionicum]KXL53787.1 antirestriction protein (ArdA) [Anaerotignum neopropionicum]